METESGPIFQIKNPLGFTNLGEILKGVLALVFFVAGIAFFIMLLLGGIQWITAGGDAKALDSARARITNAVIGLIIVAAAYALALIIEQVFGVPIVSGFKFGGSE